MASGQVFSDLVRGLRRNVSMTVSLVVTLVVSLTLVGVGLLLQIQLGKTEAYLGNLLQVQVEMCADTSSSGACIDGAASDAQLDQVEQVIDDNDEVESYYLQTPQDAYDRAEELLSQTESGRRLLETVSPESFPASYWVTLQDPQQFESLTSQVNGLPGVDGVRDQRDLLEPLYDILGGLRWVSLGTAGVLVLAAILQVANTIRLAAYARRREIGIMRLVGASAWHIQLPFLLESLLAALVGAALATGALAAFQFFLVRNVLTEKLGFTPWVTWGDMAQASIVTGVFAVLLALVPTLVMTRKYLDV